MNYYKKNNHLYILYNCDLFHFLFYHIYHNFHSIFYTFDSLYLNNIQQEFYYNIYYHVYHLLYKFLQGIFDSNYYYIHIYKYHHLCIYLYIFFDFLLIYYTFLDILNYQCNDIHQIHNNSSNHIFYSNWFYFLFHLKMYSHIYIQYNY